MNKNIYKIGRLLSLAVLMAIALTACEKDDQSNPTFKATSPSFTLNVPANAQNNTYDLASANGLTLTCSQPDYNGVP
jgi:predicted component of type VI protein secretion system